MKKLNIPKIKLDNKIYVKINGVFYASFHEKYANRKDITEKAVKKAIGEYRAKFSDDTGSLYIEIVRPEDWVCFNY